MTYKYIFNVTLTPGCIADSVQYQMKHRDILENFYIIHDGLLEGKFEHILPIVVQNILLNEPFRMICYA